MTTTLRVCYNGGLTNNYFKREFKMTDFNTDEINETAPTELITDLAQQTIERLGLPIGYVIGDQRGGFNHNLLKEGEYAR